MKDREVVEGERDGYDRRSYPLGPGKWAMPMTAGDDRC